MAANNQMDYYMEVILCLQNGERERVVLERPCIDKIQSGDQKLLSDILHAYNDNARQAGESLAVSMELPDRSAGSGSACTPCSMVTQNLPKPSCSSQSETVTIHKWKESEEQLLVTVRAGMEDKFTSSKSHSVLWNEVQRELKQQGVPISAQQAKDKWRNLKRRYTETVDQNAKTGNQRHFYKYFDIFSNLYGTKASTRPSFVLDTTQTVTDKNSSDPDMSSSSAVPLQPQLDCANVLKDCDTNQEMNVPHSRKRQLIKSTSSPRNKMVKLLESIDEKNEEFNNFVKEQEEQKMRRFDRFLDLFEKSLKDK